MTELSDALVVTGGAGFIGCNFVRTALAHGAPRVVVLDLLTYAGSLENLRGLLDDGRVAFVRGDIADPELVTRVYREHRPRAVVNFAAESHVDRSIDGPAPFLRTNVMGTFQLLDGARALLAGADAAARERFRFLHVSTDEVFGSLGPEGAFREDTPYAPNSPYSATKAAADHLVRAWRETYGVPTLITNCSNNYGPFQFPEKLIPLMLLTALEGGALPIYGDGGNVRDWLHVEDHCEGIWLALGRGRPGERYNIGGSNERTNLELVDLLCAELEAQRPARDNAALRSKGIADYAALRTFVADRPGHDRRYAIDSTRIRRELGWAPRHDLASGLRHTVRWYLENGDWCRAIQRERYQRQRLGLGDPASAGAGP
ncbi:MAG: dTDP-glucose 4,6-dehydratase [Deltaproteobacteria bacterium]|nr:dTDP-glucose 4,6-dehydratase [Deltaproteobacteria bacterium]